MAGNKTTGKYESRAIWEAKVKDMKARGIRIQEISEISCSTRSSITSFLDKGTRY